jgi:putative protease
MELMSPQGNCDFVLGELWSEGGESREVAPGSGHVVRLPLPEAARSLRDPEFAVLARYL